MPPAEAALADTLAAWQGAAAIAVLALLLGWESWRPFFGFFRARTPLRARHAGRNLALGAGNAALVALVFAGAWAAVAAWAHAHRFGLLHALQDHAGLPPWGRALGAVLLFDVWTYAWHRVNHRVPFLWRFHRVHHADTHMDVTTASRFHAGELALSSLLRLPLIALIGAHLWELVLYETAMFAVVQFHHANVGLPPALDRVLRVFIVTPSMHKVHHSDARHETDSNYSALFSWWDRLFRSFRLRDDPGAIRFGLDTTPDASLAGLLRMPFDPTPTDPPRSASDAS